MGGWKLWSQSSRKAGPRRCVVEREGEHEQRCPADWVAGQLYSMPTHHATPRRRGSMWAVWCALSPCAGTGAADGDSNACERCTCVPPLSHDNLFESLGHFCPSTWVERPRASSLRGQADLHGLRARSSARYGACPCLEDSGATMTDGWDGRQESAGKAIRFVESGRDERCRLSTAADGLPDEGTPVLRIGTWSRLSDQPR